MVYKEFALEGQMVTKEFYLEVLGHRLKQIARVRPEIWKNHSFNLLHDNAPAHSGTIVQQFLVKKRVPMLSHSVYSPDLSPLDYFAFTKLKIELKGYQYKNILEIQKSVMVKLKVIPIHEGEKAMNWLKNCVKECIRAIGDYFE